MTQDSPERFPLLSEPSIATAGTFDGVHLGHMAVLDALASNACGLTPIAITFDRHPLETIAPERAPKLLSSPARQRQLIEATGASLLRLPFDKGLALLSAREWLRLLRERMGVRKLIVGYDNTFGHDGLDMTISDYAALGKQEGIEVIEAPVVEGISSSRIRRDVAAGRIEEANAMLGREYELDGVVVGGKALGRKLGRPTANLMSHPRRLVPGAGVYAAIAVTAEGENVPAMVNIGTRPTVENSGQLATEAHLIGWDGDLYTQPLTLRFISRLRDEKHFDSLDDLKQQLDADEQASLKAASKLLSA